MYKNIRDKKYKKIKEKNNVDQAQTTVRPMTKNQYSRKKISIPYLNLPGTERKKQNQDENKLDTE